MDVQAAMLLPVEFHEHLVEVPAPLTDPAHARSALADFLGGAWYIFIPLRAFAHPVRLL